MWQHVAIDYCRPLPGRRNLYSPDDGDKFTLLCDGELVATHRWETKLNQRKWVKLQVSFVLVGFSNIVSPSPNKVLNTDNRVLWWREGSDCWSFSSFSSTLSGAFVSTFHLDWKFYSVIPRDFFYQVWDKEKKINYFHC